MQVVDKFISPASWLATPSPTQSPSIRHREALIAAVEAQARQPQRRLGEILLDLGFITPEDLDAALACQRQDRHQPLGELLIRAGCLSRAQLDRALQWKLGYARVDAAQFPVESAAVHQVAWSLLQRVNALPLALHQGQFIVALPDPRRQEHVDELSWASGCWVRPVLAEAEAIALRLKVIASGQDDAAAGALPASSSSSDPSKRWRATAGPQTVPHDPDEVDGPDGDKDNALVQLINTMIIDAIAQGASDIHIEVPPARQSVSIRFRCDGRLKPYRELPHSLRSALVARIKIMGAMDIAERRRPQDGKIDFARHSPEHPLELRVVTIPTVQGLEDVVLRLLTAAQPRPLDQLGIQPRALAAFRSAVERPHGLILCAGPTGSGKTTTLHSVLAHLNTPERKIWTAEDPIEITQAGLRQVQIHPRIDWTFEKALRSFLRADPDVVMVGEIRDRETARMTVEAALTGHLVVSTIHTNSAPETVTRLLDMGLDAFQFGDSLLAVLGQRLVRRHCPHCVSKRPATASEVDELIDDYLHAGLRQGPEAAATLRSEWMRRHAQEGRLMIGQAPGCEHCGGTGMCGRIGLHELLVVDRAVRRLIHRREPVAALQDCALEQGMSTLRQDGIEKVLQGLTSLAEVRANSNAP